MCVLVSDNALLSSWQVCTRTWCTFCSTLFVLLKFSLTNCAGALRFLVPLPGLVSMLAPGPVRPGCSATHTHTDTYTHTHTQQGNILDMPAVTRNCMSTHTSIAPSHMYTHDSTWRYAGHVLPYMLCLLSKRSVSTYQSKHSSGVCTHIDNRPQSPCLRQQSQLS